MCGSKDLYFGRYFEIFSEIFFEIFFWEFLNFSPFTAPPRGTTPTASQTGRRVIGGPPLCHGGRNSASHSACQNEAPKGTVGPLAERYGVRPGYPTTL